MNRLLLFLFLLNTFFSFSQFPESFESGVPPTGWVKYRGTNNLGTAKDWETTNVSNTGSYAAFVRYENVSGGIAEDWLVTPQFTPSSSTSLLTFMERQSYTTIYGSNYSIRISTSSQTTHGDFNIIESYDETDFTYYYTSRVIDLSNYIGTPIYVAFVMSNDDGDNCFIFH